jgi:hypothetical protein
MPVKNSKLHHTFEFDYTVTTSGVPQPYPVRTRNAKVVIRYSPAEDENGREFSVLNICGNRKGLEYLAAMLLLTAESAKYDPAFHIHLEEIEGVESDMDVTIRAPAYFDALRKQEFSEFKGTPIPLDMPKKSRLGKKINPRLAKNRASKSKPAIRKSHNSGKAAKMP